jgi:hypothetical protein
MNEQLQDNEYTARFEGPSTHGEALTRDNLMD